MFWKFNSMSSSQIDILLDSKHVTLRQLMDEEDIINECKLQNRMLIDFLSQPAIMEELVMLVTAEPLPNQDEKLRFKYSNIACEILTSDISVLNELIAGDKAHLGRLYGFLEREPPLNPLLASFYSKIMTALIVKKTEQNWLSYQVTCLQVIDFLKAKESFVANLLKHLGTSAIMDLMLKLLTQIEGADLRQNVSNWLNGQGLIQSLIAIFSPSADMDYHYNTTRLLQDFVKVTRDNQRNNHDRNEPNILLKTLESPDTMAMLIDHMLSEPKTDSCIVSGVKVLLVIVDVDVKFSPDQINEAELIHSVIESATLVVLGRLEEFHALLAHPPQKEASVSTGRQPPVGSMRLHVIKLLGAMISKYNVRFINKLVSLGTTEMLLDLFFDYPNNNFLHTQVEGFLRCMLRATVLTLSANTEETDNPLYEHIMVHCKLIERILGAWDDNEKNQRVHKLPRQGYMGHLTNIALYIAELCETTPLGEVLRNNMPEVASVFSAFVEGPLENVKKLHRTLLGGVNPMMRIDEGDEYAETGYNVLNQQMYAQYQSHQLIPQAIDFNYDIYNPDYIDGDSALQTIDDRTGINFDLSEGDLSQRHELFKQVCAQTINTLDDADDQIFDERDHTYQTIIEKRPTGGGRDNVKAVVSSDSDEEDSPPIDDPFMSIDPWASGKSLVIDPWTFKNKSKIDGGSAVVVVVDDDWANFNAFDFDKPSGDSSFPSADTSGARLFEVNESPGDCVLGVGGAPHKDGVDPPSVPSNHLPQDQKK